ncbi:unnamed protein product, partial [marine sediment metagenome]
PNNGDFITDSFISKLGSGSEKVVMSIGNNPAKLAEYKSKLINDPSGMEAMLYLGKQQEKVTLNKKRTSQARKPAVSVSGNKQTSSSEKAEKKKYSNAKTAQERYKIAKAAGKKGFDTKEW